jgi:hypothetical protein
MGKYKKLTPSEFQTLSVLFEDKVKPTQSLNIYNKFLEGLEFSNLVASDELVQSVLKTQIPKTLAAYSSIWDKKES